MATPFAVGVLPGPVRQIGYVVHDLDAAIESWLALGVGPFFVLRNQPQDAEYRGQPCSMTLSIAFASSGDLQIELIHQEDDSPSIYTEFLESGHEGFHQLAWWTTDFTATMAAVEEAGWPVACSGGVGGLVRYAYLEPPDAPATIIELMELNDATRGLDELVRSGADGWDGTDPIRNLL